MMVEACLPLPAPRCLSKDQAAEYLGIGVTLLAELSVPAIKLGRRCVYDIVDLDDFIMFQGKELHELVAYSSKCWASEEVARRNGLKHIEELKNDKG